MNEGMTNGAKCACPHHKVVPLLIALFGLDFLLTNLGLITEGIRDLIWPTLITLAGLSKVAGGACKCC